MKRYKPMRRTSKPLHRAGGLKKRGPVARLRDIGNAAARRYYFNTHATVKGLLAPCQACHQDLSDKAAQAHHKRQSGEDITNKLILHDACHKGFVHDQSHPEHRKAAEMCAANAKDGGFVDWARFGLAEAFFDFVAGRPSPKGIAVPGKKLLCHGCREQDIPNSDLKLYVPCIIHAPQTHDPLFEPKL